MSENASNEVEILSAVSSLMAASAKESTDIQKGLLRSLVQVAVTRAIKVGIEIVKDYKAEEIRYSLGMISKVSVEEKGRVTAFWRDFVEDNRIYFGEDFTAEDMEYTYYATG